MSRRSADVVADKSPHPAATSHLAATTNELSTSASPASALLPNSATGSTAFKQQTTTPPGGEHRLILGNARSLPKRVAEGCEQTG